jgi:membrane associated rhomboid family serine protease
MTAPQPGDTDPAGSAPTCYRHPDRETHIRCSRCDRPICPDCMVSASVGFQCPECVREGNQGRREWRTQFGGRVHQDQGRVSLAIIVLCVVAFVLQQVSVDVERSLWLVGLQQDPGVGAGIEGVATGQWWRLLTTALLHGSIFHLLFNMYALWLLGPSLEAAFGRVRFLTLYVLSALGGSAASYAFNDGVTPSVGASGAIFGLFAGYLVVSRKLRMDASALWGLLAINLVLGFVIDGIDWRAHLGGLAAGAAVAAAFAYAPRARRTPVHVAAGVAVAVVCVVLVGWQTADLWRTLGFSQTTIGTVGSCAVSAPFDGDASFTDCVTDP